jgi:hypothetical protein
MGLRLRNAFCIATERLLPSAGSVNPVARAEPASFAGKSLDNLEIHIPDSFESMPKHLPTDELRGSRMDVVSPEA